MRHKYAPHSTQVGAAYVFCPATDEPITSLPVWPSDPVPLPPAVASSFSQALSQKCCSHFGQPLLHPPSVVRQSPHADSFSFSAPHLFSSLPFPFPPSSFQALSLNCCNKISCIHTVSRYYCRPTRSQVPAKLPNPSVSLLSQFIVTRLILLNHRFYHVGSENQ